MRRTNVECREDSRSPVAAPSESPACGASQTDLEDISSLSTEFPDDDGDDEDEDGDDSDGDGSDEDEYDPDDGEQDDDDDEMEEVHDDGSEEELLVGNVRGAHAARIRRRRRHRRRVVAWRPTVPSPATSSTLTTMGISPFATLQLATQVEELRRRRDAHVSLYIARLLNNGRHDHLLSTVLEYYDTFRSGLVSPQVPGIMQFLQSRIDRDRFAYGASSVANVDTLMEQWRRYTRMLPSLAIRVRATNFAHLLDPHDHESMARSALDPEMTTCMVEAQGTLNGVISRQLIDTVLPHLRFREDLVHLLLHQLFDCPIHLRFYFNGVGRVIRLDFHADYFQAFSNVRGVGLVELAQIMEHAAIGENSTVEEIVEDDVEGGGCGGGGGG